jgi:ABC-type transporter Mla MlaB component
LPSELTICTVGEFRLRLLAWLDAAQESTVPESNQPEATDLIDGACVDEVDAAGVQLLIALARSLARVHRALRIKDPSQPLAYACDVLGVSGLLAREAKGATS